MSMYFAKRIADCWYVMDGERGVCDCRSEETAHRIASALEFAEHREEIEALLDSDDPLGFSYQLRVAATAIENPQGFNLEGIADFLRQKSVEISELLSKLGGTANAN